MVRAVIRTHTSRAKRVRHGVVMPLDFDVVIEADLAFLPFRVEVRFHRQRLERRPLEFFEQLSARAAEPADRPLLVEPFEQIADRCVQLGQAVEPLMAQSRQNPSLDDENRRLDLGLGEGRRLQVVWVRPASRCASRIPFIRCTVATFELICRRRHWGEDRVVYAGEDGRLCTIASALTDIDPVDEFRLVAADKAAFRTVDLLALCEALDRLAERMGADDA